MERLRGKIKAYVSAIAELSSNKKYEESVKTESASVGRTLDILVHEFKASAGSFKEFHSSLNGREKILFKEYIDSMRGSNV